MLLRFPSTFFVPKKEDRMEQTWNKERERGTDWIHKVVFIIITLPLLLSIAPPSPCGPIKNLRRQLIIHTSCSGQILLQIYGQNERVKRRSKETTMIIQADYDPSLPSGAIYGTMCMEHVAGTTMEHRLVCSKACSSGPIPVIRATAISRFLLPTSLPFFQSFFFRAHVSLCFYFRSLFSCAANFVNASCRNFVSNSGFQEQRETAKSRE